MNDSQPSLDRRRPSLGRRGRSVPPARLLSQRRSDQPARRHSRDFRRPAVRRDGAGGLWSMPRRSSPICRARPGRSSPAAQAGRAEDPLRSPPASAGDRLKSISVIEIVNDDMPFLVDSVMGELTERGLDVRLVAHPIFAVERDKARQARRSAGEARQGGEPRESFIHIHVERIDDAPARDRDRAGARSRCWPTCGSACRTGGRCWRASTR